MSESSAKAKPIHYDRTNIVVLTNSSSGSRLVGNDPQGLACHYVTQCVPQDFSPKAGTRVAAFIYFFLLGLALGPQKGLPD